MSGGLGTAAAEVGVVAAASVTLLCSYRVAKGPTVPDRMAALDAITTTVVSVGALHAIASGRKFYLSVSLILGVIGFISTVTVAKFVEEGDIIE